MNFLPGGSERKVAISKFRVCSLPNVKRYASPSLSLMALSAIQTPNTLSENITDLNTPRHSDQGISTSVNNIEVEDAMDMGRPTMQMVEHWDVTKLTEWLKALDTFSEHREVTAFTELSAINQSPGSS